MKTLTKILASAALCSIALTGCGSDKKDKTDAPSITATTPSNTPTPNSKITTGTNTSTSSTRIHTSSTSIHSVTQTPNAEKNSSATPNKNNTPTSSVVKSTSSTNSTTTGKKSGEESNANKVTQSSTPKITTTNNFFKNTKNVIWASSGDFTNKKLNNKAPYNYKNLDKGLYTIDVNCSGGGAKLSINGSSAYNVECNGVSDDNVINACLKNKSDVNSVLTASDNKVKYIWQMRKVSSTC